MTNKIKRLAQRTLLKNNIFNSPTYNDLLNIIESNNCTVIPYNKYSNSEYVSKLISQLKLEEFIKNNDSFLYLNGNFRFVFINEDVSYNNKRSLLRHELGHILDPRLTNNDISYSKIEQEEFANEFSYHINNPAFKIKALSFIKRKRTLLTLIIMLVLIFLIFPLFKNTFLERSVDNAVHTSTVNESNNLYYTTPCGEKYHHEFCIIIKNRTNLSEHTLQEATENGYKPCLLCIGPLN